MFTTTSWVRVESVARLFPQVWGGRMPYFAITRDGDREATVAALAQSIGLPAHQLVQALQRDELQRLARAAGGL